MIIKIIKRILKTLFTTTVALIAAMFKRANRINVSVLERLDPVLETATRYGSVKFCCRNELTLWRARTLFTKEPDTLAWIDSLRPGEIYYDVGANVGLYTVYAAKRGLTVYAFEPESQNYALLNRNIHLNQLQDRVNAYQVAISSSKRMDYLYISTVTIGGAMNNFGEPVDFNQAQFTPDFKQATVAFPLDTLVEEFGLPAPQHLKIDVDGLEHAVVEGARRTLSNPAMQSVLIELNDALDEDRQIVSLLKETGFELASKYHAPMFDDGPYKVVYNHIFRRRSIG